MHFPRTVTKYQVLATKVNNAVKLSIESYVFPFKKAHKRDTGDLTAKGNISVGCVKSFQRNYPYGAFAAAVLGFTDADGMVLYGLEKSYQSTLAGVDGRTITQRNAYGNAIADENCHHLCSQGWLQSGAFAGCECAGDRGTVSERSHCSQHGGEPRLRHRDERQDRCHPCHGFQAGF